MNIKRIVFFIIVVISIFTINNLITSIYTLWQKNDLILDAKESLTKEKQVNAELKKKIAIVNKPQFVEEEARNKLFLGQPGEDVVLLPSISPVVASKKKIASKDLRPNWQQWWETFF